MYVHTYIHAQHIHMKSSTQIAQTCGGKANRNRSQTSHTIALFVYVPVALAVRSGSQAGTDRGLRHAQTGGYNSGPPSLSALFHHHRILQLTYVYFAYGLKIIEVQSWFRA